MILDAALAYGHFVFAFLIAGTLVAEFYLIRLPATADTLKALSRVDLFYGLSALLMIVVGFARVYFGVKDESFYLANHAFWGKMAAFAIVGVISIIPTTRFLRWRKAVARDAAFAPAAAELKSTRLLIMAELHVFALVPLLAVLVTRLDQIVTRG